MIGRVFTILIGFIGGIVAIVWSRPLAEREYQRRIAGKKDWRGRPISPEKMMLFLRWLYVAIGLLFLSGGVGALLWSK
jgi:hypothetical protein